MKKISIAAVAGIVLGLVAWLVLPEGREPSPVRAPSSAGATDPIAPDGRDSVRTDATVPVASDGRGEDAASAGDDGEPEVPKTPEEIREEAEDAAVEAFDALTDAWTEPSGKGVAMADVEAFLRAFGKIPADRREECLQRALNLVPDEHVMLLAGVLMDKSQPKELVELVFNDILNRDEAVKRPILGRICADKTHPCRDDALWILDASGVTP